MKTFIKSVAIVGALGASAMGLAQTNTFPSTGSVGIGTTAPNYLLTIFDSTIPRLQLLNNSTGQNSTDGFQAYVNGIDAVLLNKEAGNLYFGTDNAYRMIVDASGKVGIGTTSPTRLLSLNGASNAYLGFKVGDNSQSTIGSDANGDFFVFDDQTSTYRLVVNTAGNVGIGTTSPSENLTVTNNSNNAITLGVRGTYPSVSATGTNYFKQVEIGEPRYNIPAGVVDSGYRIGLAVQGYTYTSDFAGTLDTQMSLWVRAGSNSSAPTGTITNSYGIYLDNLDGGVNVINKYGLYQSSSTAKNYFAGNVGIGTTNPGTYKLAVAGKIHAQEVVVDLTGWSDYIFADDYRLTPLSEVEAHIKAEKHLPGIPSAAEVAAGGISLGDMQARLLAKVEELTLHQIAQEKRLTEQASRIQRLEAENAALHSR